MAVPHWPVVLHKRSQASSLATDNMSPTTRYRHACEPTQVTRESNYRDEPRMQQQKQQQQEKAATAAATEARTG